MTYPDNKEKILVGKQQDKLIYLFQEKRMVVMGFPAVQVLPLLAAEYRSSTLIPPSEFRIFFHASKSVFLPPAVPDMSCKMRVERTWSVGRKCRQEISPRQD